MQDHYFDVVTNVVGLVAAVLGDKFYWWIDPVGAIVLAIYTISNWSGTVLENAGTYSDLKAGLQIRSDPPFSSLRSSSSSSPFSFSRRTISPSGIPTEADLPRPKASPSNQAS